MIHRPGADRILIRWRLAGLAATCLAVAGAALMASAAPAATRHVTLKAERVSALNATVLAGPNGRTLYRLKPETARHLLCTSASCLSFWHPLTVPSKSTKLQLPRGLAGRTHLFKRGHGFQVTLGADPLYTYGGDSRAGEANGKGIRSFGGTWLTLTVTKHPSKSPPPPMPGPYPTY
jgi:predicted lipoprotein with Yx(FWY)xxD motif